MRKEAARAFSLLGLDAKAAVPALARALREDKAEEVRQQAALALGKMLGAIGDNAKAMLEAIRKDSDKTVRVYTVHALADSHGPALKAFVKDLADQLGRNRTGTSARSGPGTRGPRPGGEGRPSRVESGRS